MIDNLLTTAIDVTLSQITLNCNDKMIDFYASLGYRSEEGNSNYMCIRTNVSSPNTDSC